jgi:undecaprenyl-diphosphatase
LARGLSAAKARPLFFTAFFLAVFVPFILFGKLAEEVLEGKGLPFDEPILRWFHTLATPARDQWVVALTNSGGPSSMIIAEAVAVAALLFCRKWREAEFLAVSGGGAALLNVCAKLVFSRQRPQLWETIVTESSFSFPSGHSIGSMSFALALSLLAWPTRWRWPVAIGAMSFAVAIGLTRLYLGVHYPSDVAAGWCAAFAWVGGIYAMQRWRSRSAAASPGESRR